ncbi:MAG: preprotein translocase subunit SecG [Bryobacteraceae bacterium]|jgi:preprotein translocase subunit SecG
MLTVILTVLHVLVCLFMVVVVLLQSGKAADLAGAFGGMGSQTTFGPRGTATALSKATAIAAVLFMLTSLSLAILATRGRGGSASSILDSTHAQPVSTVPARPRGPVGSLSGSQVGGTPAPGKSAPVKK